MGYQVFEDDFFQRKSADLDRYAAGLRRPQQAGDGPRKSVSRGLSPEQLRQQAQREWQSRTNPTSGTIGFSDAYEREAQRRVGGAAPQAVRAPMTTSESTAAMRAANPGGIRVRDYLGSMWQGAGPGRPLAPTVAETKRPAGGQSMAPGNSNARPAAPAGYAAEIAQPQWQPAATQPRVVKQVDGTFSGVGGGYSENFDRKASAEFFAGYADQVGREGAPAGGQRVAASGPQGGANMPLQSRVSPAASREVFRADGTVDQTGNGDMTGNSAPRRGVAGGNQAFASTVQKPAQISAENYQAGLATPSITRKQKAVGVGY